MNMSMKKKGFYYFCKLLYFQTVNLRTIGNGKGSGRKVGRGWKRCWTGAERKGKELEGEKSNIKLEKNSAG
jgi:hypothetical protein